jgi:hypothetical protein
MSARPRRSSRLLLATAFVLVPAAPALADGVNLYWNNCSIGGTMNKAFACDANAGVSVLVASFDPPTGITQLASSRAVIDLRSASNPMPSWWRLGAGGCREGSLSVSFTPPASQFCADYWSGSALQELSYSTDLGSDPTRARIVLSFGKPQAVAGPVTAGTEYYAFELIMDNLKSTGAGACAGCLDPCCIVLNEITLYQTPGLGDYRICAPLTSNFVTWQGGAIGGSGCPGAEYNYPCTTPVLNRTWGQMKGLYR